MTRVVFLILILFSLGSNQFLYSQILTTNGQPAQLDIRVAGNNSIRVTLKPLSFKQDFPDIPSLADRNYPSPVISLRELNHTLKKQVGNFKIEIQADPITIIVKNSRNELLQRIVLQKDGKLSFKIADAPILGLGEGGPKPIPGKDWRMQAVEFDRRGIYDSMQPRWQGDAYGSRNPVPMIIGTEGWAIFVAAPWVHVDLRNESLGFFIPWKHSDNDAIPQNEKNQDLEWGKGLPPVTETVPGLYDFFVFDAHEPERLMKDISIICGPAVMPPKWTMGYMQSHRLLEDEYQMIGVVDTFRTKKIPVDAVIYLGTGFTPRGWNKKQPSFEFNPAVFRREPEAFFTEMHKRHVKVVLHMVPWDRDKLPTLHGSIPARPGELMDSSHLLNYWAQHIPLMNSGADAFWPDEGDWFNLYERIKRHQLYYQGPLSTHPNLRPWSLHRNGFLGIAKWGGWVWSGDVISSWKTLQAQIAVGINHSLSLSPFWGSDIGGFTPSTELTGELYTRWFQFAAFNASFRAHGNTWRLRLPWGWAANEIYPREGRNLPPLSEMNNKAIEPIVKKYDELRYQLLPYNYTIAWEAHQEGLPMMRALWLHYPRDKKARMTGDEFLWGSDFLIAPVYEKGASSRSVYLPEGEWYDWWTNKKQKGGEETRREVDLTTMPIYVRAGAIIPFDPIRQYTSEEITEPTTLKIFTGANGNFVLYQDDGISLDYLEGKSVITNIKWNDRLKELTIEPAMNTIANPVNQIFKVELIPMEIIKTVTYSGKLTKIKF